MRILPVVEAGSFEIPAPFVSFLDEHETANRTIADAEGCSAWVETPEGKALLTRTIAERWPALRELGEYVRRMVRLEPGFVVVRGLRFNAFHQRTRNALLLSLLSSVGEPTDHSSDKRLLWPVTPRTVDPGRKTTFSEELGEAPPHTDSAFSRVPERFLSLFVVREAEDGGGQSVLLGGRRVIEQLEQTVEGRRCIHILRAEHFPFRVPDAFFSGERLLTAPILAEDPLLRFRYDCIQSGFAMRPDLATPERVWAVDFFYEFVRSCKAAICYQMRRGELIVFDNHRLLHSRTDFVDPDRMLIRVRMHERAA